MADIKVKNQQIRERFIEFLDSNYNPQLKTIAKAIGVNYQNLVSWKIGNLDYGKKNLDKVEAFLDNRK